MGDVIRTRRIVYLGFAVPRIGGCFAWPSGLSLGLERDGNAGIIFVTLITYRDGTIV